MLNYMRGILNEDIICNGKKNLEQMERSDLRALRSDLKRNAELRYNVNNRIISMDKLCSMTFEERATSGMMEARRVEREDSMKGKVIEVNKITPDDLKIITNYVEDP